MSSQPSSPSHPEPADSAPRGNDLFYLIVCGLLTLITITMGALWWMERKQKADMVIAHRQLQEQYEKVKQFLAMPMVQGNAAPIRREMLPSMEMTVGEDKANVLLITASQAATYGLLPGDVLMVSPAVDAAPSEDAPSGLSPSPDSQPVGE